MNIWLSSLLFKRQILSLDTVRDGISHCEVEVGPNGSQGLGNLHILTGPEGLAVPHSMPLD